MLLDVNLEELTYLNDNWVPINYEPFQPWSVTSSGNQYLLVYRLRNKYSYLCGRMIYPDGNMGKEFIIYDPMSDILSFYYATPLLTAASKKVFLTAFVANTDRFNVYGSIINPEGVVNDPFLVETLDWSVYPHVALTGGNRHFLFVWREVKNAGQKRLLAMFIN